MAQRPQPRLLELDWPRFGEGAYPRRASAADFDGRIERARAAMAREGLTHLVIYADREHFANLAYLTGFDPRFEEAVLVIGRTAKPLLVVGNECEGYLPHSPNYAAGSLRHERFQPFSLLGQPRNQSRALVEILGDEGIGNTSSVGMVGFKYFGDDEISDSRFAIDVPSYITDAARRLASFERVVNATGIFMHPRDGLRTRVSVSEIAYFEYTNVQASEGMRDMLFGLKLGMTDHELARLARWNGEPLGCHMTLATGPAPGLCGPTGRTITRGEPLSTNISYWGSNICRAGWIAESADDLAPAARDYVERFAGVYFQAMAGWFQLMKIGTPGREIWEYIARELPFATFGIFLNPGHLIHLEEWVSTPVYAGSELPIASGMAMQVDVIPSHPVYGSTRMEDGIVIADETLRAELRAYDPECYARCQKRRSFMTEVLGIELPDEVLPLSNTPAIVPPYFLRPGQVIALET